MRPSLRRPSHRPHYQRSRPLVPNPEENCDVARRPLFRAARLAALATLTVSCALALAPAGAAVAAPVAPSPSPSSSPSSPTSAATPALATFGLTSASGGRPDNRSFLAI